MKKITILLALFCTVNLSAQVKISLSDFATGFDRPVDIAHCGDSRIFVVEQDGLIWVLDSLGNRLPNAFLNIDPSVNSTGNEQGLLGLAFHPNYAQNGYFYVSFNKPNGGDSRVSRFTRDSMNANLADPNSEKIILELDQPYTNHNGGSLKFGPDGYLYIGFGDGGSGGDPQNYGQNRNSWLGKLLRIDIDGGDPYAVPSDNPFVANSAFKPEIFLWGLRNPWRISFDALTGDLWIGDVGQNAREEIDLIPAGTSGQNFGWRCYEGNSPYNTNGCQSAANYTSPVFEYPNPSKGCSITGGYVYRGSEFPDLQGVYLFADYCSGRWWAITKNGNGTYSGAEIGDLPNYEYSSFGDDRDGNLYVATLSSGKIQKVKSLCTGFSANIAGDASACFGSNTAALNVEISGGQTPIAIQWSNNVQTAQNANLAPGTYSVSLLDGNGCIRRDTFMVDGMGAAAATLTSLGGAAHLCGTDTVQLSIAGGIPVGTDFQWYFNNNPIAQGAAILGVSEAGDYQIGLTVPNSGCPETVSAPLSVGQTAAPAIEHVIGDSLFISGNWTAIQWFSHNGSDYVPIAGANSAGINTGIAGLFMVVVSDQFCTFSDVEGIDAATMPDFVKSVAIAPNPTAGIFSVKIQFEKSLSGKISVLDLNQKTLFSEKFSNKNLSKTYDLSSFAAGVYFVKMEMLGQNLILPVIKN